MTRRSGTFLMAAVLVLLGPAPMSLCATLADLPADCMPTPHCDSAGEGVSSEPGQAALTAPLDDCCTVGSAPLPERQANAPAPAVSLAPVILPGIVVQVFEANTSAAAPHPRSAPDDLQSALCVFLI